MSDKELIHAKEAALQKKWKSRNEHIPVHQTQYAFDTAERESSFVRGQFPTDEEMRRYEWYREEWHRRPKEGDPGEAPLAVACELVSTCNLSCGMCYTITDDFAKSVTGARRILPWNIVKSVIDECAEMGVVSLLLSWRGEPTLYKSHDGDKSVGFADAVAYARKRGILEISAITHGQLIDDAMASALVEAQPSWISFSVDGMGADYNRIRTPNSRRGTDYDAFSVVLSNIKRLAEARNRAGKTRPQIRSNAIYPAIAADLDGYRAILIEAGVDMLTVNELLDLRAGGLDEGAINANWGCPYPFQRLTVSANGVILPCTGAYLEQSGLVLGRYVGIEETPQDASQAGNNDSLSPMTLRQAWKSPKLQEIRRLHLAGKRTEITPGCRDCNHGAVKHGATRMPEDWDSENMTWRGGLRKG